jgi:hypothetical protein
LKKSVPFSVIWGVNRAFSLVSAVLAGAYSVAGTGGVVGSLRNRTSRLMF